MHSQYAVAAVSAQSPADSKFQFRRDVRVFIDESLDAHGVVSRVYRAAVHSILRSAANNWSHPDRMNGTFALARESKRGRSVPRFYEALGLSEWTFRRSLDLIVEMGMLTRQVAEKLKRWTAWGVRNKPHQFRFAGRLRELLDVYWEKRIAWESMSPRQRQEQALKDRRAERAEQVLRNTELRSKGLSTILESGNSVTSRGSAETAELSEEERNRIIEEAMRRTGLRIRA